MTEALSQVPDAELIAAVRAGDGSAFGVLYERHLVAAKRAATCLANTPAEREDLVAEAFTRVLRILREGRGPDEEFRPYLLVTLRNTAIHATTRGAPVSLYADVPEAAPAAAADDPVLDRWHASVAAGAFASLPERWRVVLWHTEVENESPATVAPLLGMRPNSVAALAHRAREGLRQAYLRMHVPEPPRAECRPTVSKLAGYVRHSIPLPLSRKIGKHLNTCADCRARADALRRVNDELRGLVGPAVLGAPLAAAYLPGSAVSGAVTGAVTGALSGAASGAAPGTVLAIASEATATTVSGLLAAKAALVQVATALAVAAGAVAAGGSAVPLVHDVVPAAAHAVRLPAVGHGSATVQTVNTLDTAPALTPSRRPAGETPPIATLGDSPAAATPNTAGTANGARKHGKSAQQHGNPARSGSDSVQPAAAEPTAEVSRDEPASATPARKSPESKAKKPGKHRQK